MPRTRPLPEVGGPAVFSEQVTVEIRERLMAWGRTHYQEFVWRRRDLPVWQALVAEFLLLRTRAAQVEPVFGALQKRYPNPRAFGDAPDEELVDLVASLGLRWRGRLLVRLAREIGHRDGRIPLDPNELRRLPGVGDYVAAATLALHGGRRAVLVDSNIVRLLCRLVGSPFDGETRRRRWLREFADRLTPEAGYREYGYAILDHSMSVCRPRNPLCPECPLRDLCASASGQAIARATDG